MIKNIIYLCVILAVLVLLVYFSYNNTDPVSVIVYNRQIDTNVGFLTISSAILGMVLAAALLLPFALIQRVQIAALRVKNKSLEKKYNKEHTKLEKTVQKVEEQTENIKGLEEQVDVQEKTGLLQGAMLGSLNLLGKKPKTDEEGKSEKAEG